MSLSDKNQKVTFRAVKELVVGNVVFVVLEMALLRRITH